MSINGQSPRLSRRLSRRNTGRLEILATAVLETYTPIIAVVRVDDRALRAAYADESGERPEPLGLNP
jgi:hypothetical protein